MDLERVSRGSDRSDLATTKLDTLGWRLSNRWIQWFRLAMSRRCPCHQQSKPNRGRVLSKRAPAYREDKCGCGLFGRATTVRMEGANGTCAASPGRGVPGSWMVNLPEVQTGHHQRVRRQEPERPAARRGAAAGFLSQCANLVQ